MQCWFKLKKKRAQLLKEYHSSLQGWDALTIQFFFFNFRFSATLTVELSKFQRYFDAFELRRNNSGIQHCGNFQNQ